MKIQIKSEPISPFSGVSFVNNYFDKIGMTQLIDSELGDRVRLTGYNYGEIFRNLTNVFLSGGDRIEDINTHLGEHLNRIPDNTAPSADTVLRAIKELSTSNTGYQSNSGIRYDFNINEKLNKLNIKSLLLTKQLISGQGYDFDYDNQVMPNNKYDAKMTYKKVKGYFPGIATMGDKVVYVENRDGNANVKFKQADTLSRAYELLDAENIKVNRSRMDAGSYSKEIIDVVSRHSKLFYIRANKSEALLKKIKGATNWQAVEINYINYEVASIPFSQFFEDRNYRLVIMRERRADNQGDLFTGDAFRYRSILTNDIESDEKAIIEYYNQRGASEKTFDIMNNDFGWKHLPFSFQNENGAFMIITSMVKNFYNFFVGIVSRVFDGINPNTRLKRFIFRFISVAGKWVYQGRRWVLKLYTGQPYDKLII